MNIRRSRSEDSGQDMFERQFEEERLNSAPLAARLRPASLDEFVGQEHIIGPGRVLRKALEAGQLHSIVLWGPPGSGKTTLANVIANSTNSHFSAVSAVSAGVADLRKIVEEARKRRRDQKQKTILFIDEIHRFNKAQQDAILPFVEDGTVTLIGATTENPSFEVISPLLSRSQVLTLKALTREQVATIIDRALKDNVRGLGGLKVELDDKALDHLLAISGGDARIALNALEIATLATAPDKEGRRHVQLSTIEDAVQHRALRYDRAGEQHYDLASALIKSLRGSDPDAAIYWLARMLESGEDPMFIARRLVILASEDVGLADPQALLVAVAAQQAAHFVGMPECTLNLAEAVIYLATAPKSNSSCTAYMRAQEEVKSGNSEPVPLHLRNAVTALMKNLGYGKDYKYAHDYSGHFVEQQFLPDTLKNKRFYTPGEIGYEKTIASRLRQWWQDRKTGRIEEKS
jgi:putative ATPase